MMPRSCHDILDPMNPNMERPQVGVGVVFLRDGRVFLARRQGSHGEATWASAGETLNWASRWKVVPVVRRWKSWVW